MSYEINYGFTCTRIDVFREDGRWFNTVYVHRSEYRSWDA